ncbi:MAG: hypothetical protein JKY34_11655 [Kordiimonadaceae bacterium]|nr:hypothetical protein [Kordiimonadaceae bacterium]
MARPLPKDLEEQIAGVAKKAEVRSVATFSFGLGGAFGFGLGAAVFGAIGGSLFFLMGAGVVAVLWFLASRRRRDKQNKK